MRSTRENGGSRNVGALDCSRPRPLPARRTSRRSRRPRSCGGLTATTSYGSAWSSGCGLGNSSRLSPRNGLCRRSGPRRWGGGWANSTSPRRRSCVWATRGTRSPWRAASGSSTRSSVGGSRNAPRRVCSSTRFGSGQALQSDGKRPPQNIDPIIPTGDQRQAVVTAISAVNRRREPLCPVFTGRLNAATFRAFIAGRRQPCFLVVYGYGHPAQRPVLAAPFVEAKRWHLEHLFMWGYAPEFNPDEFVWHHLRRWGVSNTAFAWANPSTREWKLISARSKRTEGSCRPSALHRMWRTICTTYREDIS